MLANGELGKLRIRLPGSKTTKNILGAALVATAVGGAAYAAGITPQTISNYFTSTGMSQVAARAAADSVINGQQPIPPGLAQYHAQQAGMFDFMGGWMVPVAILGVGALAFFMIPKKGGKHAR